MPLFIVGTPIGNLDDLTHRAARTLAEADVVAAEDTRRTRALLSHLGLQKELVRLDAHASEKAISRLLDRVEAGERVALCSDAGMPSISDPGDAITIAAHDRGVAVIPIPGPSAPILALSASGLGDRGFSFVGFLPRKGRPRREAIERIARSDLATVLFESPSRLSATLAELATAMPDRLAVVARELTKVHEEIVRKPLSAWASEPREFRGEITVVVERATTVMATPEPDEIDAAIRAELARGASPKTAAENVSSTLGTSKRQAYQLALALSREGAEPTDDDVEGAHDGSTSTPGSS